MYLARYSNQPDLGAYLPRLQVPNSLLHSFKHSNIQTIFSSIITNNQNQDSNQINNYTKNKNKTNKSCPSSADYVSAPHVTISSKEFLPPISKSNVKSAAPQIPVSSSFPSFLHPPPLQIFRNFHNNNPPSPTLIRVFESLPLMSHLPRQLALDHRRNFSTPLPPLSAPNQTPRKRAIRL